MTRRSIMNVNASTASTASARGSKFPPGISWCGLGSLLVVALFAAGCHKATTDTAIVPPAAPVAAAPDTNQNNPSGAVMNNNPGAPPPPTATAATLDPNVDSTVKPNGEPDLHALDRAILRWRFANQRKPSSFAEFAASAGVPIPPAPPGKAYTLSASGHIILVTVK
jgi:hypothetical protein